VQTEKLKALSYAKAAVQLCPNPLDEKDVIEAFKDVVGLSRHEVAKTLVERFGLEEKARSKMAEFGVNTAWQVYVQLRLKIYEEMLADSDVICRNQWPHNMDLLQVARRTCCFVGLATMSYCTQVQRILGILDLDKTFDFIASRDDVERGKPNPEIYLLVAQELGVSPAECLVVEDSPAGVKAALAAGMVVIAVSTPFTRERLHASGLLPKELIIDEPDLVAAVVGDIVRQSQEYAANI
jgi:beta-phosphoglucomutase